VPNVAYRAGGVAEVIRHGQDGLLARCGDVAELTAALRQLIEQEGLRRQLGRAGERRTQREFRWKDKLDRVTDIYQACRVNMASASSNFN
jgi:glycosyltransferase involved in cell wall biosynthesis